MSQGPKVLTSLAASATLDGYNTGLSAAEDVPGSVEARLCPDLAQSAEFLSLELDTVNGGLAAAQAAEQGTTDPLNMELNVP